MGKGKKGKISLAVSAEGDPRLSVIDKDGKVLLEVPPGATEASAGRSPGRAERNAGHESPGVK
jgi:hypothetical protein